MSKNINSNNKSCKHNYFKNNYLISSDSIKITDNNKKTLCNID